MGPQTTAGGQTPPSAEAGYGRQVVQDLPAPLALPVLSTLLAAAPVGFAVLDTDLRYLVVNEALAEINGVPAAAHVGRSLAEVVPDLSSAVEPLFRQVLETGRPLRELELSGEVPAAPGVVRHWLESAYPVPGDDGRPAAVAVLVWDVTDRRNEQAEQAETLALLDTLLLKAPVGLAFLDTDLRYVRINETLAAFNRRPVEAHLGRPLIEVLPQATAFEAVLRQVLTTGAPAVDIATESGQDGVEGDGRRSWLSSFYPVPGTDGQPIGVGLVVTDVTQQRRVEAVRAQAAERLALLSRVSAVVGSSLDLGQMLEDLAELTVPAFADHCFFDLAEPDGHDGIVLRRLLAERAPGVEAPGSALPRPGALAHYPRLHPVQDALAQRRAVLVDVEEAVARVGDTSDSRYARRVGMRSGVIAPLLARGETVGIVTFLTSISGRRYDEEDRALAEELAARAAIAVTNARAYERERRARAASQEAERRLRLLADASVALAGSLRRDEVLEVAFDLLVPAVGDWCAVHLVGEDGGIHLAAAHHHDPSSQTVVREFLEQFPVTLDVPGPGRAIATGTSQLLPSIDEDVLRAATGDPAQLTRLRDLRMVSGLAAPLTARGRTFGVLSLVRERGQPYRSSDLVLAEELGGRVALALDNARLYAAQRDVAVALQRSLLPHAPQPGPGLAVAARYLPGAEGAEVGGDWYDVIRLPEGRTGIAIGDVMGRGIHAAAVMGQLRAALRGYALEGHAPADLLRRLDVVVHGLDELNLTTCAYGVYDPATRQLTIATAGHLPPLLAEPGVTPRYLELEPALPLGVGDGQPVEEVIDVAPGSLLLLYTDGLVEEASTPIDKGMATLSQALAAPVGSPDEACERALAALEEHGHHDDDTALLAVLTVGPQPGGEQEPRGAARAAALELASSPRSPRAAREFVARSLRSWGLDALGHTAQLLTSELVANAVQHAAGTVDLAITAGPRSVTVSVRDDGGGDLPAVRRAPAEAEHGRGLLLVDSLADRWGAERHPNGKRVWFELELP